MNNGRCFIFHKITANEINAFFFLYYLYSGQKYAFLFMATIIVNLLRRFRFVTVGNLNDVKTTTDIVLRLQHVKMSIFRI